MPPGFFLLLLYFGLRLPLHLFLFRSVIIASGRAEVGSIFQLHIKVKKTDSFEKRSWATRKF